MNHFANGRKKFPQFSILVDLFAKQENETRRKELHN